MTVQWRKLQGFDGYAGADDLEVSTMGDVRSISGVPVRWCTDKYDRLFVRFAVAGHREALARMVLFTFVGPPQSDEFAVFKNGVLNDCRLTNLEWGRRTRKRDKTYAKPRPHTGKKWAVFNNWLKAKQK